MAQSTSDLLKIPEHLAQITMDNSTKSPLLRLPPELRNEIYGLVFDKSHFCTSARNEVCDMPKDLVAITGQKLRDRLRISSTCRQLYAETAVLPITSTVFEFALPFALVSCIKSLSRHVREVIRKIGFYARYGSRNTSPADAKQMIDRRVEEAVEDSAKFPSLERIHIWCTKDTWFEANAAHLKTFETGVKRRDGRVIKIIVRFSEYMSKRPWGWGSLGMVGDMYRDQYARPGVQSDRRH